MEMRVKGVIGSEEKRFAIANISVCTWPRKIFIFNSYFLQIHTFKKKKWSRIRSTPNKILLLFSRAIKSLSSGRKSAINGRYEKAGWEPRRIRSAAAESSARERERERLAGVTSRRAVKKLLPPMCTHATLASKTATYSRVQGSIGRAAKASRLALTN